MGKRLGRSFFTIVRPVKELQVMLAADPYAKLRLPPEAKRVVTFLARPQKPLHLPIAMDGARIVAMTRQEAFAVYLPNPRGPVFMTLIEKTFGKDVTTRTWDTVRKCAIA